MTEYRVLDLFCGLGGFSQAFEKSNRWAVTTVDIEARFDPDIQADVFDLRPSNFEQEFDLVLASPPCTSFSLAANGHHEHFDGEKPQTEQAADAVALVYHTLGLIRGLAPRYWVMENPRGKLRTVLGPPTGTVTLCQYGYDWQKPTDLWGEHPPMQYPGCSPGDDCHQSGPSGFDGGEESHVRDPAERAKLPRGLSDAIHDSIEAVIDGEKREQASLTRGFM